ncbi:MAG: imidazole glycerol phosphate synthase subunit HisH [Bacillota bacterium]|nr:imidazole glycerol phosphate synthase subunit HisH [Bacillota bacterium]
MIAIIDYGVGNLFSLQSSLKYIGEEAVVTADVDIIRKADRIILPGVGAFKDAAAKLRDSGMADIVMEQAKAGKPLMGICLGMQLLLEKSFEYGEYDGLGLIKGQVVPIADAAPAEYKIPHIGWNALKLAKDQDGQPDPLFKYINEGDYVYFVHSYYAADCAESTIATTEYGAELTAAVSSGNVYGCQFHPEKSGDVGMKILRAFCEMTADGKEAVE